MKVIVAGGRNITDFNVVKRAVEESGFHITEIVYGDAKGVDTLGKEYGKSKGIKCKAFPANWKDIEGKPESQIKENKYGKYWVFAGYERNIEMAEYADALIAVWDGKSRGTKHMIDTAEANGLQVYIYGV